MSIERSGGESIFLEILNREEPAYPIKEEDCEQQGIAGIDTGPVNKAEIRRAKKSLKNGKAPGTHSQS